MDGLHVSAHYHVTQLSGGGGRSGSGAVGPLFIVLAIIMVLGVIAGFIGRVCSGRHWGGDTQYDFEGWVEKRCASCIDGDIEAPPAPPPPPPPPPDKPPEPAAPPSEVLPPAADAPPPAEAPPAPADAPPPAAEPAPAADPPAEAPAAAPAAEAPSAPAEAAAPPPSEPLPPPPPPPPPPEDAPGGAASAYAGLRTEPLTYMQLYPSYSCSCHICAREGIFA